MTSNVNRDAIPRMPCWPASSEPERIGTKKLTSDSRSSSSPSTAMCSRVSISRHPVGCTEDHSSTIAQQTHAGQRGMTTLRPRESLRWSCLEFSPATLRALVDHERQHGGDARLAQHVRRHRHCPTSAVEVVDEQDGAIRQHHPVAQAQALEKRLDSGSR